MRTTSIKFWAAVNRLFQVTGGMHLKKHGTAVHRLEALAALVHGGLRGL